MESVDNFVDSEFTNIAVKCELLEEISDEISSTEHDVLNKIETVWLKGKEKSIKCEISDNTDLEEINIKQEPTDASFIYYQTNKHQVSEYSAETIDGLSIQHENSPTNNCDERFINSSDSKTQSTSKKSYQCDICNKYFSRTSHLKFHKFTHTGEKPYQCDICKKSFTQLSSLKPHKRVHTGERPHQCEVCTKSFTQLHKLKIHKLLHTDKNQCDTKRKHKTLTLALKAEILKRLDQGEKMSELAKCYNIGRSTIHDIRRNRLKIENFVKSAESGPGKRQTLKCGEHSKVEEALYAWFLQERGRHAPISGEILREKAKFFYRKITAKDDFKASDGWLNKFKKRYGIRLLTITGEKLSSDIDTNAVEPFIKKFERQVKELDLIPDQIYNADETGLLWRLMPHKTFVNGNERKVCKDRITFMPCSNASGTHKLQLLVVGKSKKPKAFKNISLPVVYKSQSKAWVTRELFKEWFYEDFVVAVRKFMKRRNLPQKALLVLDNAPGHRCDDQFISKDGKIRVMFLPSKVKSLLQPMDQNVIPMIKSRYKKKLLIQAISQENDIGNSLKGINLKDVVFMLAEAWKATPSNVIATSWKKLWPSNTVDCDQEEENTWETEDDIPLAGVLKTLMESKVDVDNEDVKDWLQGDGENVFMDDQDIIDSLQIEDDDTDNDYSNNTSSKLDDVFASFNTCVKWAEENFVSAEDIMTLRKLRENVFKKSFIVKNMKIDS